MWSASESGMWLSGTFCFAPCARAIETAARLIRIRSGIRNEKRKRRLGMIKLNVSMGSRRQRSNVKAPETAGSGPLWEKRFRRRARRSCAGAVQSAFPRLLRRAACRDQQDYFDETDGGPCDLFSARFWRHALF